MDKFVFGNFSNVRGKFFIRKCVEGVGVYKDILRLIESFYYIFFKWMVDISFFINRRIYLYNLFVMKLCFFLVVDVRFCRIRLLLFIV